MQRVMLSLLVGVLLAGSAAAGNTSRFSRKQTMREKMKSIRIPRIYFEDAPVSVVFEHLKRLSRIHSADGSGVNFVLILKPDPTRAKRKSKKSGQRPGSY